MKSLKSVAIPQRSTDDAHWQQKESSGPSFFMKLKATSYLDMLELYAELQLKTAKLGA